MLIPGSLVRLEAILIQLQLKKFDLSFMRGVSICQTYLLQTRARWEAILLLTTSGLITCIVYLKFECPSARQTFFWRGWGHRDQFGKAACHVYFWSLHGDFKIVVCAICQLSFLEVIFDGQRYPQSKRDFLSVALAELFGI